MTKLEILLVVLQTISLGLIYMLVKANKRISESENCLKSSMRIEIDYNKHLKAKILEAEKKAKLSNDVLEMLHDMKEKGAIFEVTRIDRNDIFFHNGSVYR